MEKVVIKRVTIFLIVVSLLIVAMVGSLARGRWVMVDSGRQMALGTFWRVRLRCRDEAVGTRALEAARKALEEVDMMMSTYREDSELSEVNRLGHSRAIVVSRATYDVLTRARWYGQLTDGAFDITVGPLLDLWKRACKTGRWPNDNELREVTQLVGYDKVVLSEHGREYTVTLAAAGVQVNVNALAKGYAVDRVLDAVRVEWGGEAIEAALVDIGGEIACFGQRSPGRDWVVGVQNPFVAEDEGLLSERYGWRVRLSDCAVATSGNYRQYLEIDGRRVSHIIDPRSGACADGLPSVTIIAKKAIDADALATAISVMGVADGMALVESLDDVEAILISGDKENPRLHRSSGFGAYEVIGN